MIEDQPPQSDEEWRRCGNLRPMLRLLGKHASARKLRLFGCACCRRLWDMMLDEHARRAVELFEAFADKRGSLKQAQIEAEAALAATPRDFLDADHLLARGVSALASRVIYREVYDAPFNMMSAITHSKACPKSWEAEFATQLDLLRDVFSPFAQVHVDPRWLRWEGGTVQRLARAAYDGRLLPSGELDPARLSILADALEESGCSEKTILRHLRAGGAHVRGCWAVDSLTCRT